MEGNTGPAVNQGPSPKKMSTRIPLKAQKSEENIDYEDNLQKSGGLKKQTSIGSEGESKSPDHRTTLTRRVLLYSSRGEWSSIEAVLKSLDSLGIPQPLSGAVDEVNGFTPLMYAVRENRLPYMERFLELGCDINAKTMDGCSVIHLAVSSSREDVIRLLFSRKADINVLWNGQTILHTAASRQAGPSLNIVKLILHQSKEFKLRANADGLLPLHLAIENGNYNVVKELLMSSSEFQVTKEVGPSMDSPLHMAARRKDAEMVRILLDYGAIVDVQNKDGQTALHIAASEGDEATVRLLHAHHANPNLPDEEERTPLHMAAEKGRTAVVEILADKYKASLLDRTKDGSTLLHVASLHGHPDTALMLLKKGVPLHMPNKNGARSIHIAARLGHVAVVHTLIQRGEHVDTTTNDNYTALHIAVEAGKANVVETLLGFGAQVHIKAGKDSETPLHVAARTMEGGDKCALMLLKSGADSNITNSMGCTPLHVAAKHGRLETAKLLLEDGADPTVQDSLGETPLHHAAESSHLAIVTQLCAHAIFHGQGNLIYMQSSSGETALHSAAKSAKNDHSIALILLRNGGDVALFTHASNETVLHYCAKDGHTKMTEAILAEGSNSQQVVNIQDAQGRSPLLLAAKFGHTRVMELLLKNQARVDVFDSEGFSALHLAAESGHMVACDLLLAHKAFVNSKSRQGLTPLHLAALKGYTNLLKRLVTIHGATTDSLTLFKETPLQLAAGAGQIEVCRLLLEIGSDPEATDDSGQRAVHRAAQQNHSAVLALFLQYQPALAASANKDGNTCAHIAAIRGSVAVLQELMQADRGAVTTSRNRTNDSTPLHLAAEGGHTEVVKVLLDCGASPLDENKFGFTPVQIAACYGHTKVLEILRQSNVSSLKSHSRKNGLTALHVAACYGQSDTVRELLSHVPAGTRSEPPSPAILGSVPVLKDLDGESGLTPLHLAAYSGDENVVRLLLNSPGVSVDSPSNQHGYTPLHLACRGGHSAIAGLLLARSTSLLTIHDREGRTPLHAAAASGHTLLTELLLGQGSEINGGDKEGWTPLHLAAFTGHEPTVQLLLDSGASPRAKTFRGRIPLWYAVSKAHAQVVSILLKREHDPYLLLDDRKFIFNLMLCGKGYKALEEFVLESPAPVDVAAKLSYILANIATKEKERFRELVQASKKCELMASELLAIASGSEGASRLLTATDRQHVQLLDVLVENEQKEVIANSAVQRYLQELWMGGLQWSSWKMMLLFLSCVFMPLIWLILSLPLGHRYDKIPVIRFMCYLTSHIYLMALLTLASTLPICPVIRDTLIPCWYEWVLLAWLSGNLLAELSTPRDRAGLGWFRVAVLAVGAAAVLVHGSAFCVTDIYWPVMMFARNQLLAIAFLFSCILILDFLSFHYLFGPWAIIIGNLMVDAGRFLIILAIFMFGFSIHVAALNQPFEIRDPSLIQNTITQPLPSGIAVTPLDTFELLFFALFGLTSAQNLRMEIAQPQWTIYLFKIVFGAYMLVSTVVLINMLIAMMSDTYQRIQAQSDTEWKYGLAKLVRSMHRTSATPSPLNLVTSWVNYLLELRKKNKPDVIYSLATNGAVKEDRKESVFKRAFKRQNSQVSPIGSPALLAIGGLGSQASMLPDKRTIEGVTDWKAVVKRYLVLMSTESDA